MAGPNEREEILLLGDPRLRGIFDPVLDFRAPECHEHASRLQRANRLREFIAAVEDRARHDGELTPEKQQGIEWARAKAHWRDPLFRCSDPIVDTPGPGASSYWRD